MKIRKQPFYFVAGGLLSLLLSDLPRRQVPTFWETGLAPGDVGRFVIQEEGDITLKFVAARLGAGNLEIVPVPFYQDQGPATRSIQEIARRFSLETHRPVMAAVNGGFFDTVTGLPIGFLLRDGQMEFFNMPQGFQRSMVGFSSEGRPGTGSHIWIDSPREMPKVWLDTWMAGAGRPVRTATLAVHQINVPGGKHALSLFTPAYRKAMRLPEQSIYLAAEAEANRPGIYRVTDVCGPGRVRIPPHGLVVALHGDARATLGLFQIGTLLRPRWTLPAQWKDHAVAHGLLAGPRLLAGGKIDVTAKAERLDLLKSRDRMALAVRANGEVLLVWAHKNSRGDLSFEQVAELLEKMGAQEAIALDGGKSRAILAQAGQALADERYFEGGRPVANALVLAVKSANRS